MGVLKLQLRHEPHRYVNLTSGVITLGRDAANGFVLDADGISDFHAEVTLVNGSVYIEDLLSRSGTYVNDRRVGSRSELKPWDVIRVGSVEIELNDPAVQRPAEWSLEIAHPDGRKEHRKLAAVTSIGRDPGCSVTLESDLLSRRHAEIRIAGTHVEVTDLGSANGTYLNNRAIREASGYAGDEIFIEPYRILLVGPVMAAIHQDNADRTHLKTIYGDGQPGRARRVAPGGSEPDHTELLDDTVAHAELVERSSVLSGARISLGSDPVSFGRHPDNGVVLPDRSVSKFHARISYSDGEWRIEDLASSNGIKVNGERCAHARLVEGDSVELGRVQFEFRRPER